MLRAGHNPNAPRRVAARRPRRGGTTGGLLVTLSLLGALAATAAVVTPAWLLASPNPAPQTVTARAPAHQEVIELLGSLISRSREVLAVHPRGADPYLEIVLWLEDGENRGRVDPDEIAVITHSEVMRTITYFGLEEEGADAEGGEHAVDASDIRRRAFCAAWRSRPDVPPRVLATGIATMEVQAVPRSAEGRRLLRISLTWPADLADGPDEASVLLDVLMRPEHEA